MKKKMINVLNWLKSRKTAFLSCLLVVCLGCSLLALNRQNKRVSAAVVARDDRAYLMQTYLPPVLFYPNGSGAMFTYACPLSFYILPSGFAWSSGAEYVLKTSDKFSEYTDYGTYFYHSTSSNPAVALTIQIVRCLVLSDVDDWVSFYNRCMRNEYTLSVVYTNVVINTTTVPNPDVSVFPNNVAYFRFDFIHNDNAKYNCAVTFSLSSINAVRNTYDFKLTNQTDISDDSYQIAYYYTVATSIINVATDNQYEQGYDDGKNAGLSQGQITGYNEGKTAGLTEGEQIGYEKGLNEKLQNITPWQTIVDGVNSFLNFEILPSIKLSVILSVGFGLVLLGLAIKIFLGG